MTDLTWPFGELRPLRYGAILADPAWRFNSYSTKGEGKSAQAHYACMSLEQIKTLPVGHLAQRDCLLIMWATSPMLPQALETMGEWGFRFITAGAWAKQSSTGRKWAFGTGHVMRSACEFFLVGAIGQPEYLNKATRNLIVAPTRGHSRKPAQMHHLIEKLVCGPYLELFARSPRRGWEAWGNEKNKFEADPE